MVIIVGAKLEAALNERSRVENVAPEVLALNALRERFLPSATLRQSQDEWEQRLRRTATDCGVSLSNAAVSSEGICE
ncbi:MAG TPA: hypothetical protein VGG61_12215 [Gemmataceae bacterium]